MSVGTSVGKLMGNPNGQESGFSLPVPVPSPEGGGTRDGEPILGTFRPNGAQNPNGVGKVVGTDSGTAAYKAMLAADPRFAAWAAMGTGEPL